MKRLERLRSALREKGLDGLIVTNPTHVLYLTGFSGGEGLAIVGQNVAQLLVDFRYVEQAERESPGWERIKVPQRLRDTLAETLQKDGFQRVGVEASHLTVEQWQSWRDFFPNLVWEATTGLVEDLRLVKEEAEISAIRQAAELTDRAFEHILGFLRPGVTEREVALELEFFLRKEGASGVSFPLIVAAGPNGSMPHHQPGTRPLAPGDLVVIDMGCVVDHYCSDFTRTVALKPVSSQAREIYEVTLRAQQAGLAAIRAGVACRDADAAARQVINEAGFGEYFGHGLGHGVGLEIHERPRLGPTGEETLAANMVVTVEPGIYLPGVAGVRIEDLVRVTPDGIQDFTAATKDLIEL